MRLDTIVLLIVIVLAVLWLAFAILGLGLSGPMGVLGLAVLAVGLGVLAVVIYQRLTNREDDHYDRNVDR